jgi:hypothetical protein
MSVPYPGTIKAVSTGSMLVTLDHVESDSGVPVVTKITSLADDTPVHVVLAQSAPHPTRVAAAATEQPKRPVTSLPNRLTITACLDVLDRVNVPVEISASTGEHLDIREVDKALASTSLSIGDRIRFKEALTSYGLLSRGKPIGRPTGGIV